jgi:hypothetical protein
MRGAAPAHGEAIRGLMFEEVGRVQGPAGLTEMFTSLFGGAPTSMATRTPTGASPGTVTVTLYRRSSGSRPGLRLPRRCAEVVGFGARFDLDRGAGRSGLAQVAHPAFDALF